ncbi:class I SAM-dependent methyltransferase [Thauera linaloolentis]|uniref:Type 12 methyltransferase n=1 Tax=Thauera linaloolentis (strain DSM 12138 / JCM 21573 / CCUG 41526 / CIP 105981 / IAM 15112 / NBRC 102519 / 47Lol) TaxID=1123367 RepID=N6Z7U3_THAL4|nr:class I SAM-dependent methyltransferase [Thauera linaloolentis]ENO90667.1 type 12 methyltransferase [Thauera linaloolentis 47Lol = DSM 12138]MCM8565575.1 class I SAM-dependent methyltransferase [Thauera linaloolentis]
MPPALKALLAQLMGTAGAFALASSGALGGLWPLVASQAGLAAASALVLRSERWWLAIHLGFLPLAVLAHGLSRALGLHPGWYLAGFVLLLLVYWTSFRTQVPLYLSNRATAAAVGRLLPAAPACVLDIGAGTGSLLRPLARMRTDCRFTGIELAPAPWLLGRLLAVRFPNIEWRRGDLFAPSWSDYDVVYAFLSPVPMAAVWAKACAEMKPGSLLVSNGFVVPGAEPERIVEVADRRGTRLHVYRMGTHGGRRR